MLKPCPLCGSQVELAKSSLGYFVICRNCGCELGSFDDQADAEATWNHRPHLDAAQRDLERLDVYLTAYVPEWTVGSPEFAAKNAEAVASLKRVQEACQ